MDSAGRPATSDIITAPVAASAAADSINDTAPTTAYTPTDTLGSRTGASSRTATIKVNDADVRHMTGSHPFSMEARKVLSGALQETDSMSRHRILSYCEHLRTSDAASPKGTPKTAYSIRSKREYLERLAKIFDSGKEIDLNFSGFRIMRHPTMEGIYGVTLRQQYACGGYADDGWLFLLWDFRNPSMPLIHVRTWQPANSLSGEDDIIDMSDFNLE